jgi:glutathione synthase/RimK-type ligase-like ATP-grasp enzyme
MVTTSPERAREFYDLCRHSVIYKSVSGIRSIVRRMSTEDLERLPDVACCPTQFQEFIDGTDVRVHVVGEHVYAAAIESSAVDYRYALRDGVEVTVTRTEIPEDIAERCVRMSAAMKLTITGIDLRRTRDGRWYCFEVNPSPAFGYYEDLAFLPISEALCRLLSERQPDTFRSVAPESSIAPRG